MAHSAWSIPNSTNKTNATVQKARAQTAGQARTQANFAAIMEKENAASGAQAKPVVARLPETQNFQLNANVALAGRTPNDLLRMQAFNKASADIRATKAMDSFMGAASSAGGTSLDIARGLGAANNLRVMAGGGGGKGFALSDSDFIHTRNLARIAKTGRKKGDSTSDAKGLGKLSAKFESGGDGIAAIGYDSTGGTSYGKYQIASKVGSMKSFLAFLDGEAPDLAKRLRGAGPANTGSRRGAMPDAWRAIAKEQPERFEQLQEAFIHQSHYKPALDAIAERTGIDAGSLSSAMREVIWSTAVQHGPAGAARIFAKADDMSGKPEDAGYERKMINNVYNVRAGQFGSSTAQVRNAVRNRFKQEKQLALKMLEGQDQQVATLS